MPGSINIAMIDLLAEFGSFGHLGNLEVFEAYDCEVNALLLTPQYQHETQENTRVTNLEKTDLTHWNSDREFHQEEKIGNVTLKRVFMPNGNKEDLFQWFKHANLAALVCSGSKSNLSMPEKWHDELIEFIKCGIQYSIPYLGICFGHQLLCKAYGGLIERGEEKSEGTWPISIISNDEIFSGLDQNLDAIFTHQEHVMKLPNKSCIQKIATAKHTPYASVRVFDESGEKLPAWGIQFHPESSSKVIQKSVQDGHEDSSRAKVFKENHIGSAVLKNFALLTSSQIVE